MKSWKITIPNMLMIAFVFFVLLINLIPIPGLIGNALISACGCTCYLYVFWGKRKDKKLWVITGLAFFLSICMLISSMYNHNSDLKELLWIWCYIGAALLALCYELDDKWLQVIFYLLSGYFGICIVMHRSVHYILYSTSRNGISSQMLFVMLLIYLCRDKEKKVIYLPAILNVIISVWALGRAGVLTAVFFLIGIIVYGIVKEGWKEIWRRLIGNIAILVIFLALLSVVFPTNESLRPEDRSEMSMEELLAQDQDGEISEETFLSRFASYGFKSIRFSIWLEYLDGAVKSTSNFLFGVDCSKGKLLSYYRQPHNSYLELHAKFGLFGFITVMIMVLITFIRLCRNKEGLLMLLLLTCGLRAMLDWAAFPGALDVYFWFLCFYEIFHIRKSMEKENSL